MYHFMILTLNMLTTTIVAPPSNASKWQMGFNSAFKGLNRPALWPRTWGFQSCSADLMTRKITMLPVASEVQRDYFRENLLASSKRQRIHTETHTYAGTDLSAVSQAYFFFV
jgi:hypothetical protein